ncbi:MAG: 50S ribosomal protein L17 [Saprospiraceae bacterium]|jgi:large subunit ribosomal protein L17|nr:50S ribosomal protein L17 [Saprospiraceae bacterium]
MRHGKKFNHLGRKSAHRKALLRNLAIALIEHKRIRTTLAKAKALRKFVEPLVTKSKANTTHSRRVVFSYLQKKEAVKILFDEIAAKVADRPGGYVRVIKTGFRPHDGAEMAMIEFVDYNDVYSTQSSEEKGSGRRRRRKKKSSDAAPAVVADTAVETVEDSVEEATEETTEDNTEEKKDEA